MNINLIKRFFISLFTKTKEKNNCYYYCVGYVTAMLTYGIIEKNQSKELINFLKIIKIERNKG